MSRLHFRLPFLLSRPSRRLCLFSALLFPRRLRNADTLDPLVNAAFFAQDGVGYVLTVRRCPIAHYSRVNCLAPSAKHPSSLLWHHPPVLSRVTAARNH
ncbi:hypothetical protein R3P38DRAFT_3270528 [Favolaschia claudopus]|uniref:Secreted protein n=1 Tax=Favolaschia claudopus TaxID=2862362 RepID=A0AAW0BBC0_9AGAR